MGWFDKVSTFFGGHGVAIKATSIERMPPDQAFLPVGDSVIKGQYEITFDKEVEVLAHIAEFFVMKKHADGREEQILLGDDRQDADQQVIGAEINAPYTAKKGQVVKTGFCIIRVDIPATLRQLGYANDSDATKPELSFYVRLTADVKGTILDADCKVPVRIQV